MPVKFDEYDAVSEDLDWAADRRGIEAYEAVNRSLEAVEPSTTYEWGDAEPASVRIGLGAVSEGRMPTALKRGAVVEYPALFTFESNRRPCVVISGDAHPFHGEEYVALSVTTTAWEAAIPIPADAWVRGGLLKSSYVKPWQPPLLKHDDVIDAFGFLESSFVDRAVNTLGEVVGR